MAEITAALVKELREKTGAGMMDCKKALTETKGAFEDAVDWLRKKGLSAAAKKSGRVAAEGLVGVVAEGKSGAMVEINAETDFVGRNEEFQGFVAAMAKHVLAKGDDVEALKAAKGGELTNLIAKIGENMAIRRAKRLTVANGLVAGYIHNQVAPGLGKIGVLVALESAAPADKLAALGKQLTMHIAAAKPEALTTAEVDPAKLERERNVLADQARASGKPEAIIAKMVEGRLRKYYEEVVLMEQTSVLDNETKIAKVVEAAGKEMGAPVKIAGFARFALGEGIEKAATDFAAEVAAAVKTA
ncbi:MAG: elongation factor Ts [Alphaproteobacteria bacterium]|nr:elongation factor Ts [Alphaproteobacteria bacterium]